MGRLTLSLAFASVTLTAGCGASQVSLVSSERPSAYGAQQGSAPPSTRSDMLTARRDPVDDETVVEPDHPAVDTKQERALVHVHGPDGMVCSGVMVGPRLVATAQQCVKGQPAGVSKVEPGAREFRVELASSTLTWTNRRVAYVVSPGCDWHHLDAAILVLAEPAPWVEPLRVTSSPDAGAKVEALGFGTCGGAQALAMKGRPATVRNRAQHSVVIDVPLCKGDIGGPVVDGRGGDVIGIISHRADPDGSPLKTTKVTRLDTGRARDLLAQAKTVAEGSGAPASLEAVACR